MDEDRTVERPAEQPPADLDRIRDEKIVDQAPGHALPGEQDRNAERSLGGILDVMNLAVWGWWSRSMEDATVLMSIDSETRPSRLKPVTCPPMAVAMSRENSPNTTIEEPANTVERRLKPAP